MVSKAQSDYTSITNSNFFNNENGDCSGCDTYFGLNVITNSNGAIVTSIAIFKKNHPLKIK